MRLSHPHPQTDEKEGENVDIGCDVIRKVSLRIHYTLMCMA